MDYFFDRCFDKKRLKQLLIWFYQIKGDKKTLKLLENLKTIGFQYATKSGLSICIEDLQLNCKKYNIFDKKSFETQQLALQYERSNLTQMEYFQQLVEIWTKTNDQLTTQVIQHFQLKNTCHPLFQMAFSGARGNISQVRQLVGMRGLMSDPQGHILDFPIRSNFREGLTLTEYIISCYGARKGIVDTALRTATSGYLTRRLVDVAQHVIIEKQNCGSRSCVWISNLSIGNKILLSIKQRCIGRILAKKLITSNKIFYKNEEITISIASQLNRHFKKIPVKSPLTCASPNAICQSCYGWNLATECMVSLGEAVGVLAAQSIGEPGTQLTMRTFHTGGVVSGDLLEQLYAPFPSQLIYTKKIIGNLVRTSTGKVGFLVKEKTFIILLSKNLKKLIFRLPLYTLIFCKNKQKVQKNQLIAELTSRNFLNIQSTYSEKEIYSQQSGQIFFDNITILEKKRYIGKIKEEQKYYTQKMGILWVLKLTFFKNFFLKNRLLSHLDLIDEKVILQKIYLNIEHFLIEKNNLKRFKKLENQEVSNFLFIENDYFSTNINIYYKKTHYWFNPCYNYKCNLDKYRFLNSQIWTHHIYCFRGSFTNYKIYNYTYIFYFEIYLRNKNYVLKCTSYLFNIQLKTRISLNDYRSVDFKKFIFFINKSFLWKRYQYQKKKILVYNYGFSLNNIHKNTINFLQISLKFCNYYKKFIFSYYNFLNTLQKYGYVYLISNRYFKPILFSNFYKIEINENLIGIKSKLRKLNKNINLIFFIDQSFSINNWGCFLEGFTSTFMEIHLDLIKILKISNKNIRNKLTYFKNYRIFIKKYETLINRTNRFKVYKHKLLNLYLFNSINKFYKYNKLFQSNILKIIRKKEYKRVTDKKNELTKIPFNYELVENKKFSNFSNYKWSIFGFKELKKYYKELYYNSNNLNLIKQFRGPFNRNYSEEINRNWKFSIIKKNLTFFCLIQINLSKCEFLDIRTNYESNFVLLKKDDIYQIDFDYKNNLNIFLGKCLSSLSNKLTLKKILLSSGQSYALTSRNLYIRKAESVLLTSNGIIHIKNKTLVKSKTRLFTMFYTYLKSGDIVQGIPKIEEFFEARQTRGGNPLFDNLHNRLKYLYNKYKIQYSYDKAVRKALLKLQQIIVNEIQFVYTNQGVFISDKHLEIIIRQMTSKVRILDGGSTGLLRGELVDLIWVEKINQIIKYQKIKYEPTILGITKTCLETNSFISAASFQETTRILMKAAIQNKMDFICGLKENVILGHLIPAGTGFITF